MGIHEEAEARLQKLNALRKQGIDPYPARTNRTHTIATVLSDWKKLEKETPIIAGRIRAKRGHGGLVFARIEDGTGKIQIAFKKDALGETRFNFFKDYFDIGDFIEITGTLFETKMGEKTLQVKDFQMLTKSLLPLPEKWHGFTDVEERLRKRYLDILCNPETKDMVRKRAMFWSSIREFLTQRGFLEVETPILETTPGGADARPFITHHNALNIDVYLRISMGELWQKKLIVAGFEKTFEIGRQFRNEGMDAEHLQDYTQMEFYWGYADYTKGMKLVEEMYKYIAQKTFGTLRFQIGEFDIDFGKPWEKYDYTSLIKERTGVDITNTSLAEIEKTLRKLKIEYDKKGFNLTRAVDNLWKYCRKSIAGPGFLVNVPIVMEPLAKRMEDNPNFVQRFQVIVAGSENGKGYSELNDPVDQANRFKEQQALRDSGDEEAQRYDKDFVEALEHGMPPTCGFGVSERLFSFLMNKPARECQIFPLMKPKK